MKFCKMPVLALAAATLFPTGATAADITGGTPSGTLPVIYVNTDGGKEIHNKQEGYFQATYWIDPMGTDFDAVGSETSPAVTEIKARGNYTWDEFDKKPYKLKLDKKTPLLGMVKNKHFALLAHADDTRGFLRNAVGFELARRMGLAWTPEAVPVEFVFNGDYKGLYFLTETIRIDETRIDIPEQGDLETDPETITGGWIVEIDNYDEDPHITIHEPHYESWLPDGYDIWFTYDKSMDEASPEQLAYLESSLGRVNQLIYADDKDDSAELESCLDIQSLAKFYLVQELVDNYESFHGSCYLWRDRGEDSKWTFGPVWDFGSAFRRDRSTHKIHEFVPYYQVWIAELLKFPAVKQAVTDEWEKFKATKADGIERYIDTFIDLITPAAASDLARWPEYGNDNLDNKKAEVKSEFEYNANLVNRWYGMRPSTGVESAVNDGLKDFRLSGTTLMALAPLSVITADGRATGQLRAGESLTLNKGIYIVSSAKGAFKVAVR